VSPDEFAWEVLSDTVAEEGQMLYEPLAALRALLPEAAEPERQRIAERTLRALHGAGLIAFVRDGDPEQRLAEEELEAAIAANGWRTVPVEAEGRDVWLVATEAGRRALDDAPPGVAERRERGA
jgi:hypothetical protein